jgi:hypothetical protein
MRPADDALKGGNATRSDLLAVAEWHRRQAAIHYAKAEFAVSMHYAWRPCPVCPPVAETPRKPQSPQKG